MSEYYTEEELERKNSLLVNEKSLTLREQRIVQCAECLLDASVNCSFTVPAILRSTGLQEIPVRKTANKILRAGYLVKSDGVRVGHAGGPVPKRYKPIADSNGESFFRPAPRPGCTFASEWARRESSVHRTEVQNDILSCLNCLGHILPRFPDAVLSRTDLSNCTGNHWSSVDYVCTRELIPDGLIAQTNSPRRGDSAHEVTYTLTSSGQQQLQAELDLQDPLLEGCILADRYLSG